MRTFALFLTVLFSLAVILTSMNDGMATEMAHTQSHGMPHHGMALSPLTDHSSHKSAMPSNGHTDMCGMILCGPFMPLSLGDSSRNQELKPVTYRVSNDLLQSLSEAPGGKPPRI
ncbi:hypothetical protein [Thalassospira sp. TSL5-1]|uniref:hypothetical protein n=1 Tax=Thalassospira sp. TSL5-1 TaxID=1544451 RepID=UPI000939A65F|nr:hypothetical protein [Thalassospira sp. TSL5-1]OKH86577.1 hypothetical protein LF95_21655 [Thalassospira sp. TSL5-1]